MDNFMKYEQPDDYIPAWAELTTEELKELLDELADEQWEDKGEVR